MKEMRRNEPPWIILHHKATNVSTVLVYTIQNNFRMLRSWNIKAKTKCKKKRKEKPLRGRDEYLMEIEKKMFWGALLCYRFSCLSFIVPLEYVLYLIHLSRLLIVCLFKLKYLIYCIPQKCRNDHTFFVFVFCFLFTCYKAHFTDRNVL